MPAASPYLPPTLRDTSAIANGVALTRDPLGFFTRLNREAGGFAHYVLSDGIMYFVNDPELVRRILIKHEPDFDKWAFNESFRQIFGTGLIGSHGETHRKSRKVAQPPLQPAHLSGLAEMIVRLTNEHLRAWPEGEVDLTHEMSLLTIEVIGHTLFGISLGKRNNRIHEATMTMLRLSTKFGGAPRETTEFRAANEDLTLITQELMDEAIARDDDAGLFAVLRAGEIPPPQLREEIRTFLLAGHVTTAQTLACACWLMCRHPEVRQAWHNEVDQVLAGRCPDWDDIRRLPLCEMVLLETLRLYPPVWVFGREALNEVEFEGALLHRGDKLVICPWLLHRNPEHFPEPEKFDPSRWRDDARSRLPRGNYLPFSTGARSCLGEHFAMMESILVLACLAQHWNLAELPDQPDPGWSAHLLYWPRRGIHLQATPRNPFAHD